MLQRTLHFACSKHRLPNSRIVPSCSVSSDLSLCVLNRLTQQSCRSVWSRLRNLLRHRPSSRRCFHRPRLVALGTLSSDSASIDCLTDLRLTVCSASGLACLIMTRGPLSGTDLLSTLHPLQINLPFGAITVATSCFLLGPQPAPPMADSVAEYTERKIKRWTFGIWKPQSRTSVIFRLAALDWLGTLLSGSLVAIML